MFFHKYGPSITVTCVLYFCPTINQQQYFRKVSIRDSNNRVNSVNFDRVFYMRKISPTARAPGLLSQVALNGFRATHLINTLWRPKS
jgi:hypothetical protein